MWNILSSCQHLLSRAGDKTQEEKEETAKACEKYTERFPMLFRRPLTRKMHVLPIVLPWFIRNRGDYYKYLKMEQDGESLHHQLNELEKQYGCVKNKAEMYYLIIKELENRRNSDKTIFNSKK